MKQIENNQEDKFKPYRIYSREELDDLIHLDKISGRLRKKVKEKFRID